MAPPPASSVSDGPFHDWREAIRQSFISPGADIRIWALSPSLSSPSSPLPSPTPSVSPSGCDGLLAMSRIPTQSSVHQMHRSRRSSRGSPFIRASAGRSVPPSPSPMAASPLNDRAASAQAFQTQHSLIESLPNRQASPILTRAQPTMPSFQPQVSRFHPSSLVKYRKYRGWTYRNRAMALISCCRTFVQSQEQNPDSDASLRL